MPWAPFRKEDMQLLVRSYCSSIPLPLHLEEVPGSANDRRIPERSAVTTETDEQAINSSQQMHPRRSLGPRTELNGCSAVFP